MEITPAVLQDWLDQGLVTEDQFEALHRQAGMPRPPRRPRLLAVVAEILAYLGGALSVAAVAAITSTFWADLESIAQVALLVLVAGLLFAGGLATGRAGPAMQRVGSVLWFFSVGSCAAALTIAAIDVLDVHHGQAKVAYLGVAAVGTACSAALWAARKRALQQIAVGIGAANLVAALLALPQHPPGPEWYGLAFAGLGAAWLALTWGGTLRPERTGLALGAVALLGGCQTVAFGPRSPGLLLGAAAAGALVAAGVASRRLVAVGLGAAGLLVFGPQIIGHWMGDTLGGALTVLVVGLVLLGTGLVTARSRAAR